MRNIVFICGIFPMILLMLILPVNDWVDTSDVLCSVIPFLVFLAQAFINKKDIHQIHLSIIDIIFIVWILFLIVRIAIDNLYSHGTFVVNLITMTIMYIGLRCFFAKSCDNIPFILVLLFVFSITECICGLFQMCLDTGNEYMYIITGTFSNSGPFAASLSLGVLAGALLLKHFGCKIRERRKAFSLLLYFHIAVCSVLMLIVISRTAIVATSIGLFSIYRQRSKPYRRYLLVPIIVILFILLHKKWGSVEGRLAIYILSIASVIQHPVIGWGIGSFYHQFAERISEASKYILYSYLNRIDVIYNAYNDLLHICVEQGIIGALCSISICLLIFKYMKTNKLETRHIFSALICISLFSYPFELRPFQTLFILFAAYASSLRTKYIISVKPIMLKAYNFLGLCLAFLLTCYTFSQSQIQENAEIKAQQLYRNGHNDCKEYAEIWPIMKENVSFTFYYAQALIAGGRYHESNEILQKGTLLSNDPIFYILQGDNYQHIEDYRNAEISYQKAYSIMPNRMYPLYCLMNLYEKMSEKKKQISMAKVIVKFHPRIKSHATDEMKKHAYECLISEKALSSINESTNKHKSWIRKPFEVPDGVKLIINYGRIE